MSRVVDLTAGDSEGAEILERTSSGGVLGSDYLHDRPLASYIADEEAVKYVLRNKKSGLEVAGGDDLATMTPDDDHQAFAVVTDVRLLFVVGSADGDRVQRLPFADVLTARTESGGLRTSVMRIEPQDGAVVTFPVRGDVEAVAEYVDRAAQVWAHAARTAEEAADAVSTAEGQIGAGDYESAQHAVAGVESTLEAALSDLRGLGQGALTAYLSTAEDLVDDVNGVRRRAHAGRGGDAHGSAQTAWRNHDYEGAAGAYGDCIGAYAAAYQVTGDDPPDGVIRRRALGAAREREVLRSAPLIDLLTAKGRAAAESDPATAAETWERALEFVRSLTALSWPDSDDRGFRLDSRTVREHAADCAEHAIDNRSSAARRWMSAGDRIAEGTLTPEATEAYERARIHLDRALALARELFPGRLDDLEESMGALEGRLSDAAVPEPGDHLDAPLPNEAIDALSHEPEADTGPDIDAEPASDDGRPADVTAGPADRDATEEPPEAPSGSSEDHPPAEESERAQAAIEMDAPESKQAEAETAEAEADGELAEPESAETEPGEAEADVEPAEPEPAETEPGEAETAEAEADGELAEPESAETEPGEAETTDTEADVEPAEPEPAETEPAEAEPADAEADVEPAEPEPAETEPADAETADAEADVEPAEPEPPESEPAELETADAEGSVTGPSPADSETADSTDSEPASDEPTPPEPLDGDWQVPPTGPPSADESVGDGDSSERQERATDAGHDPDSSDPDASEPDATTRAGADRVEPPEDWEWHGPLGVDDDADGQPADDAVESADSTDTDDVAPPGKPGETDEGAEPKPATSATAASDPGETVEEPAEAELAGELEEASDPDDVVEEEEAGEVEEASDADEVAEEEEAGEVEEEAGEVEEEEGEVEEASDADEVAEEEEAGEVEEVSDADDVVEEEEAGEVEGVSDADEVVEAEEADETVTASVDAEDSEVEAAMEGTAEPAETDEADAEAVGKPGDAVEGTATVSPDADDSDVEAALEAAIEADEADEADAQDGSTTVSPDADDSDVEAALEGATELDAGVEETEAEDTEAHETEADETPTVATPADDSDVESAVAAAADADDDGDPSERDADTGGPPAEEPPATSDGTAAESPEVAAADTMVEAATEDLDEVAEEPEEEAATEDLDEVAEEPEEDAATELPNEAALRRRLRALDEGGFTDLVADLWEARGWSTMSFSASGGSVYDLVAVRGQPAGERLLLWTDHRPDGGTVPVRVVERIEATRERSEGAEALALVTSGRLTSEGRTRAAAADVDLYDAEALVDALVDAGMAERLLENGD